VNELVKTLQKAGAIFRLKRRRATGYSARVAQKCHKITVSQCIPNRVFAVHPPLGSSTLAPFFRQRAASGISDVTAISVSVMCVAIQSSAASNPSRTIISSINASGGIRIIELDTRYTFSPCRRATRNTSFFTGQESASIYNLITANRLFCADLAHLEYLPSGNTALTRRATKHSPLRAVVVQWARARKRYERQGILVTVEALCRAEEECLADEDRRAGSASGRRNAVRTRIWNTSRRSRQS